MNKYFKLLEDIVNNGTVQHSKKGDSIYLLNQQLSLNKDELDELFSVYKVARKKLGVELGLYLQGETRISEYNKAGINWWNYIGEEFKNSYPNFYKEVPALIDKINSKKRPSKNYVFFNGKTNAETNQLPCVSLLQFQIPNNKLHVTAYQRSADSNLGLPSDIYQAKVLAEQINVPLESITFFIGNAHIYKNNIEQTKNLLSGKDHKYNLNV